MAQVGIVPFEIRAPNVDEAPLKKELPLQYCMRIAEKKIQAIKLADDEIAYIGDDMIDIPVMELVGVPIATENASLVCKSIAIHVTQKPGGHGAFREAVEWILSEQGRLDEVLIALREKVKNQK